MLANTQRQIALAMGQRAEQWRTRVGIAAVASFAFCTLVGLEFAAAWFCAYTASQLAETRFFPRDRICAGPQRHRWASAAVGLIALNNALFALLAVRQAFSTHELGLVGAGLLIAGAIVNGVIVSAGSRALTLASIIPHMVAFLALPCAVLVSGGSLLLGIQVAIASLLFIGASLGAVLQLARTLQATEDAVRAAETANRSKTEFLANMSHEIRTPLNGVVGMADLLCRSNLPAKDQEVAEIIRRSGRALERLLSDVLDIARVEAGHVEIVDEPFHLGETLRDVALLARLKAEEKGLTLDLVVDPEVDRVISGDCSRLRQIAVNLLSNAVKFTPEGRIAVQAVREADWLVVKVTDTGIGFDPEKAELVFGRFAQADGSITRRFGGTGLGLAISRELAELMGGSLSAQSAPGMGSTFLLKLPFQASDSLIAPQGEGAGPEVGAALCILVADDHPTNRKVAELMLAQIGAEVCLAENGAQAVSLFRTRRFDAVLMDMQMPIMDGLEAVRQIRAWEPDSGRPRTPILMLTANALAEHVEAGRRAGADGHVTKPIVSEVLIGALAEALAFSGETEPATVPPLAVA